MTQAPHDLVRRTAPTTRPEVYDLYWSFASRRHAAFMERLGGRSWPWSDDPILQTFKFCNVFRALDRVSQYLISEVAYGSDSMTSPLDRVFQLVAFRTFSKIGTWRETSASLDFALLKTIGQMVKGYEAEKLMPWMWEQAILEGFRVFRFLRQHRGGVVTANRIRRSLSVEIVSTP